MYIIIANSSNIRILNEANIQEVNCCILHFVTKSKFTQVNHTTLRYGIIGLLQLK